MHNKQLFAHKYFTVNILENLEFPKSASLALKIIIVFFFFIDFSPHY